LQPRYPGAAHAGSHLAPLVEVVVGHAHTIVQLIDKQSMGV